MVVIYLHPSVLGLNGIPPRLETTKSALENELMVAKRQGTKTNMTFGFFFFFWVSDNILTQYTQFTDHTDLMNKYTVYPSM